MGKKARIGVLAISMLMALNAAAAYAEANGEACDRLAADPADITKPAGVKGVDTDAIDVGKALEACNAAVQTDPGVARFHYQLGRVLILKKQYDVAFREAKLAADAGSMAAISDLGYLYAFGYGTPVDTVKGLELTSKAAAANIPHAAHLLGYGYREGTFGTVDDVKSVQWYMKAYELGYYKSALDVGFAYQHGKGVPVDFVQAMRWYMKSADKGNGGAMNNIGTLYDSGSGVPKDYVKAMSWYRKSQATRYPLAYMNIAWMTDKGWAVDANPAAAADLVMEAFKLGDSWDDPFDRDFLVQRQWSDAFWKELQTRLAAAGHYKGAIDGKMSDETKAAIEQIVDK